MRYLFQSTFSEWGSFLLLMLITTVSLSQRPLSKNVYSGSISNLLMGNLKFFHSIFPVIQALIVVSAVSVILSVITAIPNNNQQYPFRFYLQYLNVQFRDLSTFPLIPVFILASSLSLILSVIVVIPNLFMCNSDSFIPHFLLSTLLSSLPLCI